MLRKSVNLSDEEVRRLAPYLAEGSDERRVLADAVGEEAPLYSDSAALKALALIGAQALREKRMEAGYREWAKTYARDDLPYAQDLFEDAAKRWDE